MSVKKKQTYTIMFAGGGTGGHIMPGLAVNENLPQNWQALWYGHPEGLEANLVSQQPKIKFLPGRVLPLRGRNIWRKLYALIKLAITTLGALRYILVERPDIVFVTGGYVGMPAGIAAWLTRTPLVIHESNAVPGLVNRVLVRMADKVMTGFPVVWVPTMSHKFEHTGNPIAAQLTTAVKAQTCSLDSNNDIFNLVIIGGSLGAEVFNTLLPQLNFRGFKGLKVYHQGGRNADLEAIKVQYANTDVAFEVFDFYQPMYELYLKAHAVICRAGAMTCAEVAVLNVPALLVPYPHAVDQHQLKNAVKMVEQFNHIQLLEQSKLTQYALEEWLTKVYHRKITVTESNHVMRSTSAVTQIIECLQQLVKR